MKTTILTLCRLITFIFVISLASGCGVVAYKKVGFLEGAFEWHELKAPAAPQTPVEKAAVQASISDASVNDGTITALQLAATPKKQLVVAVVDTPRSTDPASNKQITYYRVAEGNIVAFSETTEGPSLDADFEKTVYRAALATKGGMADSVTIYSRPDQNFTVVAHPGKCSAEVKVYQGFEKSGEPFSTRGVPICY